MGTNYEPPGHLSDSSRTLFSAIVPLRAASAERVALVIAGLEARDRMNEARMLISREGMVSVTKSTGTVHLNPCVKVELESRAQFQRIWSMLHFEWNSTTDGML